MPDNPNLKENYKGSKKRKKENIQTFAEGGNVESIPEGAIPLDQFEQSSQSGINPQESNENVPEEGLPEGAIPEEEFNDQKYSTLPEMAKTVIEGAAEGIAGAAGTAGLRAIGADPEAMRHRQEANPVIHGASNIAGFAGSMMAGTGLGKLTELAGEGALHASQLINAESIGQKITAGAVKAAAEMGILETSNKISDVIKQDPETSLQSAIPAVGLSMLMGAAGGGALASISPLWKATMGSKMSQLIDDFKGRASQYAEGTHPGSSIVDELNAHYANIKNSIEKLATNPEVDSKAIEKTIPEMDKALKKFENKFVKDIDGVVQVDSEKIYDPFLHKVTKSIKESEPAIESNTESLLDKKPYDPFTHEFIMKDSVKNGISEFLNASDKYKSAIEKMHEDLPNPINGSSIAATKEALGKPSLGAKIFDALVKSLPKTPDEGVAQALGATLGHKIGSMSKIPGIDLLGAYFGTQTLGKLFSTILPSIVQPLLEKASNGLGLKAAAEYTASVVKGMDLISKTSKNLFKASAEILPQHMMPTDKDINKLDKILSELHANPTPLTEVSDHIGHYLPDHATAMAMTASSAAQYLNSIRPDTTKKSPLDGDIKLSPIQKANWENALRIAQQPLLILQKVKDGRITPIDIQHLKGIAPKLYDQFAKQLSLDMQDHIANGESVPYKTRIGLSLFLGQGLDSTLTGKGILGAQPVPQPQQPQPGANGNVKKGTANLNKVSAAYRTPSQNRELSQSTKD